MNFVIIIIHLYEHTFSNNIIYNTLGYFEVDQISSALINLYDIILIIKNVVNAQACIINTILYLNATT